MRKITLSLLMIFATLAFILGACNTGTPDDKKKGGGGDKDAEEKTQNVNSTFSFVGQQGDSYPGIVITLENGLADVSTYASIAIKGELYTNDASGEGATGTLATAVEGKSLAHFRLLKNSNSDWSTAANNCFPMGAGSDPVSIYGIKVSGENTYSIPAGSEGVPKYLLIQANWASDDNGVGSDKQVKSIKVETVTFIPKISDIQLRTVYGDSHKTANNKITFEKAVYGDEAKTGSGGNWDGVAGVPGAAAYNFPEKWGTIGGTLKGNDSRTLTFTFTIPDYTSNANVTNAPSGNGGTTGNITNLEHQLHIQAAQIESDDKYNGENPESANDNIGQVYITLEDNMTIANGTATGSFSIPLQTLINAAKNTKVKDSNNTKTPFTLDCVRIVNNGTYWTESKTVDGTSTKIDHVRAKNWVLIIDNIELK